MADNAVIAFIIYLQFMCLFVKGSEGANILFISTCPSPSHQIWNHGLSEGLFSKGHNVTLFGPTPLKFEENENFHVISIEDMYEGFGSEAQPDAEHLLQSSSYELLQIFYQYGVFSCNKSLKSKGIDTLLNYPKDFKFDLILLDPTAENCLLQLIHRFNYPPAVYVSAFLLPPYISDLLGNIIVESFMPHYVVKYSDDMSFFERLHNFFCFQMDTFLRKNFQSTLDDMTKKKFGNQMRSRESLEKHVSLLLCNLVPGYHFSQPLTPNIIPVGGLHIRPAKTLPTDIKEIMDKAKDGVILFALGSNIQADQLKQEKINAFIKSLGKLKQTVLWKFESQLDTPKNVIIRKWLPQREILAHPNLKLFISHGGGLSTTESAYFGVPILAIPFFVDQHANVELIVKKKLGVKVDFNIMTQELLSDKLNEVLNNPIYASNMKEMSKIIRDQPETPIERAIFWLEFAIRHNGTHFLNPRSRELSRIVLGNIDIYLFILLSLTVLLAVALGTLTCCVKKCFCRNVPKEKKKKN